MTSLHPILQSLQSRGNSKQRAEKATKEAQAPAFFAEGRFPAEELAVHVTGHGPLAKPLTAAQAQQLHGLSQPSKFGYRERTLLDERVRHSGEIDADRVELTPDVPAWSRLLQRVSDALGSGPLEAWMHKLLIYGPGQFFKPHQDTEKREGDDDHPGTPPESATQRISGLGQEPASPGGSGRSRAIRERRRRVPVAARHGEPR